MKLARIAKALPPRSEPKNSQFFLPMAKGFTAVSGATTPAYDSNGNLTTDENNYRFVYDAWNKVVQVKNSSNVVIITYGRDALHRHMTDTVGSTVTDRFFSSDWQLLETKVGSNTVTRNVWSPVYVDGLVLRDRDTDANGTLDERLYALQDANWNTTALVNTSGTVQERFTYTPFGQATFRDSSGSTLSSSAKDWVFLHQGGERIAAGDYEFRNRVYSPSLGRWLNNDPLGFEAGDQNWYRAMGNNPGNGNDPSGLEEIPTDVLEVLEAIKKGNENLKDHQFSWLKPSDSGYYGKAIHSEVSRQFVGKDGWYSQDIYVENGTNKVLSFGKPPKGIHYSKITQIDLLHVQPGYRIQVGQILDSSKIINLFDIKGTVKGEMKKVQIKRLNDILNNGLDNPTRKIYVITPPEVYNQNQKKWIPTKNPVGFRLLQYFGVATGAYQILKGGYAIARPSEYDFDFEDNIKPEVDRINGIKDLSDKRLSTALLISGPVKNYVEHYSGGVSAITNLGFHGAMYKILGLKE